MNSINKKWKNLKERKIYLKKASKKIMNRRKLKKLIKNGLIIV